jgi:hypothetical protein
MAVRYDSQLLFSAFTANTVWMSLHGGVDPPVYRLGLSGIFPRKFVLLQDQVVLSTATVMTMDTLIVITLI